ncbi:MAG: CHRD domain-containing protein, partial [Hyphomicrobiales bacterium]|nr:CHRD domain-containing protein [Hyphomicrobiales bacterium]
AQAAELAAGKWYYNVHTNQNKGGELRGQVVK